MNGFRIGRDISHYISVEVIGMSQATHDLQYGYWVDTNVDVKAGSFSGQVNLHFIPGELQTLHKVFSRIYCFDSSEGNFEGANGRLCLNIKGDGLGNFVMMCHICDEIGNELAFDMNLDQSELQVMMQGIERAVKYLSKSAS